MDSTFGVQQAYTVLDDVDLEEGSGESAGLLPDEEVAHGGADLDDGDRCSHTGGVVWCSFSSFRTRMRKTTPTAA
jgi:hypothetical protein